MKKIFVTLLAVLSISTIASTAFAEGGGDRVIERNATYQQAGK